MGIAGATGYLDLIDTVRRGESTVPELQHVRFKDQRSVFATAYLEAGGSVKNLQRILGQADIKTTIRYLRRLSIRFPDETQAAAEHLCRCRHLKLETGS